MEIKLFVARHRQSYGIGLSAEIAEENMLDVAVPRTEAYRDDGAVFPDTKVRGEVIDFANEAIENLDKREAFRTEFRAKGRMVRCPLGITHVWVDDMGSIRWKGGPEDGNAVTLRHSPPGPNGGWQEIAE